MSVIEQVIYFDNNSSTPIDLRVLNNMFTFLKDNFANSNSIHHFGFEVNEAVKIARLLIAELINADQNEVIFTSGSTESINIAIKGTTESYIEKGKHILTVSTEHKAVLETCRYLEGRGYDVTYLSVKKDGLIDINELSGALRDDTILVCVMYVNNETGVVQPIKEIAALTHEKGAFFMTDATQAVGKIEIDVDDLGIDLLCMSGHKMYAPKGIGALYVRQRNRPVRLPAFLHGGGQEYGIRSGTLNVPGIVALGKACELAKIEMKQDAERIVSLRDKLENEFLRINNTFINGNIKHRIYNVCNICFPGVDANVLIGRMKNIAVSNGSACTSAVIEPSHVLMAMGLTEEEAFGSIRFSLGRFNTLPEVEIVVETIKQLLPS